MLVLLGLFVLETLASFIGPGNYKSVKQLDADINGTTRLSVLQVYQCNVAATKRPETNLGGIHSARATADIANSVIENGSRSTSSTTIFSSRSPHTIVSHDLPSAETSSLPLTCGDETPCHCMVISCSNTCESCSRSCDSESTDCSRHTDSCEDSEVRSSDINGNDEVEDRGNTGIHWIARQPTQHETEKLIENLDRFDASPDSKEYCLKEAEKMLRLADVGKDRCLFYATETHGFLATEWANASEMVTVETCARHGGLFRGRYEFSWDKKLLPFSKMQGNEIVIRNWFRATSTIFATLCKGTAYLVYDGDWTESRGDGGRASIWRTDEYNALINNDGIERIVQLGETPVRKIIDALDIKYLKEMATRQQYEIVCGNAGAHVLWDRNRDSLSASICPITMATLTHMMLNHTYESSAASCQSDN